MRVREVAMADQVDTHDAEEDARNASILMGVNGRLVPRAEATVSVYRYALKAAEARRRLDLRARPVLHFSPSQSSRIRSTPTSPRGLHNDGLRSEREHPSTA